MNYKYPLQVDPYSFWDRLKVSFFILNKKNRLTMGSKVSDFEFKWEEFTGANSAVMTSSGSTANDLLFEVWLQTHHTKAEETTVFVPATTWASSISPLIMKGFNIEFIDINLHDFSFNYKDLEDSINICNSKYKVIWVTALIGNIPNVQSLNNIAKLTDSFLFCDACECTFGWDFQKNILAAFDMVTTSFYLAHQCTSLEGGMLFINSDEEYYENALMIRNHGLTRSLPVDNETRKRVERENPIDPQFLFEKIGTNLRPTDLTAYFGLLDFNRIYKYIRHRRKIWRYFLDLLSKEYLYQNYFIVPFCLPLIFKEKQSKDRIDTLKKKLNYAGWETRPVIAFLPEHPAYKKYAKNKSFPNSEHLARNGFYVGLSNNLKLKDIDKLISLL